MKICVPLQKRDLDTWGNGKSKDRSESVVVLSKNIKDPLDSVSTPMSAKANENGKKYLVWTRGRFYVRDRTNYVGLLEES